MPLLLRPLIETDMKRVIEIQKEAFSTDLWNQVMFPNGMLDSSKVMLERARRDIHKPDTVYMGVVDSDLNNEIVSFARWYIYKQERPESEWNTPAERREWGPDANSEALNDFLDALGEKRKEYMAGEPHCCMR